MSCRQLAISIVVIVAACSPDTPQAPPQVVRHPAKFVTAAFVSQVNGLQGGESKDAIVGRLGQPHGEETRCSKDPSCSRKLYSLKYCFPDTAECTDQILLLLNADGVLYRIESNVNEVPAKYSAAHKPPWIE